LEKAYKNHKSLSTSSIYHQVYLQAKLPHKQQPEKNHLTI